MNDKIDDYLDNVYKNNIKIPLKFTKSIENALNKKRINTNKINIRNIAAGIAITFLISGTVFASGIYRVLIDIFGNDDIGVKTAIYNDYVENINTDYIVSNGVGVKVNSILMDDLNLNILLQYELNTDIKDVNNIAIQDLTITDEAENIILANNENLSIAKQVEFYRIENISDRVKKQGLLLSSNEFPKSKKLYITFTKLEISSNLSKKTIKGDWNIEINLPEEFYNRKIISYKSEENQYFNIIKADLINTGFNLKLELKDVDTNDVIKSFELTDKEGNVLKRGKTFGIDTSNNKKILTTSFVDITNTDVSKDLYINFLVNGERISVELKAD